MYVCFATLFPGLITAPFTAAIPPGALIVPDPEWTQEWCAKSGTACKFERLSENSAYRTAIGQAIERVNKDLSVIERIRRFTLADEPFTIENEQLTPSLKIRRHVIRQAYGDRLDALYLKG